MLRGPQGTLYGRNAIGGAINQVSKRPADEFGGEVRALYGNYWYASNMGMLGLCRGIMASLKSIDPMRKAMEVVLKENDKFVIGVGVKNSSSDLLIDNCDEFIFYEDLVRGSQQAPPVQAGSCRHPPRGLAAASRPRPRSTAGPRSPDAACSSNVPPVHHKVKS